MTKKEGKRVNYWRDTERERVRGRTSVMREEVWVQRSTYLHKHIMKCNMISRMNGVYKVTVSVRQINTSVRLG